MPFTLRQLTLIDPTLCKQAHMIRLNLPKEPYWLTLPMGVRVRVRAPSTALNAAARAYGLRRVDSLRKDLAERKAAGVALEGLPDLDDEDIRAGYLEMLTAQCFARSAILEWEGVLEAEGDAPAPVTREKIDELMRIPAVAEVFLASYLRPFSQVAAEGNASRPSPNGTSAVGPDTAATATEPAQPAAEASAA